MMSDHQEAAASLELINSYLDGAEAVTGLRDAVMAVGEAGDTSARAALRRVAEASSQRGNSKVTFAAASSLWKLEQSRGFFLDAIRNHAANKWLAYYSIVVLGRAPDDAELEALLESVKGTISDGHLLSAIAMAERVRYLEREYQGLLTNAERMQYVLDTFRTDWNPMHGDGVGEVDLGADPQAIWGQKKLAELSTDDPEGCAIAVAAAAQRGSTDESRRSYQRFVAGFLAEESQAHFQAMTGDDS